MTRVFWADYNAILMYTQGKRGVLRIFITLVCVHHFFPRPLVILNDNCIFQESFKGGHLKKQKHFLSEMDQVSLSLYIHIKAV